MCIFEDFGIQVKYCNSHSFCLYFDIHLLPVLHYKLAKLKIHKSTLSAEHTTNNNVKKLINKPVYLEGCILYSHQCLDFCRMCL